MLKKISKNQGNFKAVLLINLLLVMLLAAALFIFMILLKSMNPDLSRIWSVSIYGLIVILSLLTGITGIMVFLMLSKKKIV